MAMTIESYLQIIDNYTFSQRTVQRAMEANNISAGTLVSNVPEKDRDSAEAAMWEAAASIINGGAQRKQIGNRSVTTANINPTKADRAMWMQKANALRAKWGLPVKEISTEIQDYTPLW